MIADILRFNRESRALLAGGCDTLTLGDYLEQHRYSRAFIDQYIVPMGMAIWSASESDCCRIPARFFVDFFERHGFLNVDDRPQWQAVRGGSREYMRKLAAPFRHRIRLGTPVHGLRAHGQRGASAHRSGRVERFDHVFIACHSDQALRLLEDPTPAERAVLGAFPYQENEAVLHTDERLLPRTPRRPRGVELSRMLDSTRATTQRDASRSPTT